MNNAHAIYDLVIKYKYQLFINSYKCINGAMKFTNSLCFQ